MTSKQTSRSYPGAVIAVEALMKNLVEEFQVSVHESISRFAVKENSLDESQSRFVVVTREFDAAMIVS
ncbi:MAG: hypothetical protein ACF787_09935 [Rhodopirellula sp. JB053]